MASLINLKTFTDERGNLTVIEKVVPFDIKRIFYIYGVDESERGGHRHVNTIQAAICIRGHCVIYNNFAYHTKSGSIMPSMRIVRAAFAHSSAISLPGSPS